MQSPAGTDYVFLSAQEFAFREGNVAFEGTVGAVQMRDGRVVLSLGAAGSIAAQGRTLKAGEAKSKEWRIAP